MVCSDQNTEKVWLGKGRHQKVEALTRIAPIRRGRLARHGHRERNTLTRDPHPQHKDLSEVSLTHTEGYQDNQL